MKTRKLAFTPAEIMAAVVKIGMRAVLARVTVAKTQIKYFEQALNLRVFRRDG